MQIFLTTLFAKLLPSTVVRFIECPSCSGYGREPSRQRPCHQCEEKGGMVTLVEVALGPSEFMNW